MVRLRTSVVVAGLAVGLLEGPAFGQGFQFRNVALSGQQAPGVPAGLTFSAFQAVTMNASGRVGVFATLAGPGITATNRDGIWWDVPGSLQMVMRQGEPAPGQAGQFYRGTTAPNLSDSGTMVYSALFAPVGGGSRDSVWTIGPSSPPAAFLIELAQVPGQAPGVVWSGFNTPFINASDAVGFRALIGGSVSGNAHMVGQPGSLAIAAIEGAPTGVLPGVNFAGVLNDYRINSAGAFAFRSSLAGPSITTSNSQALWVRSPAGVLRLVARTGDQVPGFAPGVVYSSIIRGPEIDSAGRIAYDVALTGPDITSTNSEAALLDDAGVKTTLVQRGDQAPGVPAGVLWNGSFLVTLGEQGAIYLQAQLTGPGVVFANRSGIWKRVGAGPFTLLARAGSPAPGTSPVRNFDQLDGGSANLATNFSGRAMFVATLTTTSADGIWVEDDTGALRLVVLEGTPFDVNDDPTITVLKTVSALGFSPAAGSDDGRRTNFGDNGQVAFRTTFTDNSAGVFVGQLPPACDALDFNNDTFSPDSGDLDDFLAVLAGGPGACSTFPVPGCNDLDFNNDGFSPDALDLDAFLSRLAGGPCLQ